MSEKWGAVPGFEGYEASSLGRLRSYHKKRGVPEVPHLITGTIVDGYVQVCIIQNGRYVTKQMHHLVLLTFKGKRPPGKLTRHLNGIRNDNRETNLRWGTVKENGEDAVRHGTTPRGDRHGRRKNPACVPRGERAPQAKLTEARVREALASDESDAAIALRFGVSKAAINHARTGRNWKHLHKEQR